MERIDKAFSFVKASLHWCKRFAKGEETFLRILNRRTIYEDLRKRRPVVHGYPFIAYIDICNYCNLRCPLCPTGQGRHERKQDMMSVEAFRKIMEQIGKYLYVVRLDSWGEPLLNRNIFKIIECAVSFGIYVSFSTNLNILRSGDAERLVKSGVSEIYVSMDGATQASYESYRRGGSLQKVIENIQQIQEVKIRLRRKKPRITV